MHSLLNCSKFVSLYAISFVLPSLLNTFLNVSLVICVWGVHSYLVYTQWSSLSFFYLPLHSLLYSHDLLATQYITTFFYDVTSPAKTVFAILLHDFCQYFQMRVMHLMNLHIFYSFVQVKLYEVGCTTRQYSLHHHCSAQAHSPRQGRIYDGGEC